MNTELEPPARCIRLDLETGERQEIQISAAEARHLTDCHKRDAWPYPSLWEIRAWDTSARRLLPTGFLITSDQSAKDPKIGSAWPRPVAMIWWTSRKARQLAAKIVKQNGLASELMAEDPVLVETGDAKSLTRRIAGLLLIPLQKDGKKMKLKSRRFPAAIYGRCSGILGKDVLAFHSMTHAELDHFTRRMETAAA